MHRLGLTGGIACGKSLALNFFQALGAQTLDADAIAHACMAPGQEGYRRTVEAFGTNILRSDGTIDRVKLGAIVFADPVQRRRLDTLIHPLVIQELHDRLCAFAAAYPDGLAVADVPLLFECGLQTDFDTIVVVTVAPEIQLQRLMLRNGLSADAAAQRLAAQMPLADKVRAADYVLDNNGTPEDLRQQVARIYQKVIHGRSAHP